MTRLFPVLIPCAGKGSRTGLSYPKTFHKVNEVPIIVSIIRKIIKVFKTSNIEPIFVVSYNSHYQKFYEYLNTECKHFHLIHQSFQNGHGQAVENIVSNLININDDVYEDALLIWGDCIGFREKVVEKSLKIFLKNKSDVCLPGFYSKNAYTEFALNDDSNVIACRETKDGNKVSNFTDIGIFLFKYNKIISFLHKEVLNSYIEHRESSFINVINESCNDLSIKLLKIATNLDKIGFNYLKDLDNENM